MFPWISARTIVEENDCQNAADEARGQYPRFEEAFEALKWRLARRGHVLGIHKEINGTEYRLYKQASDSLAKTPSITVVFSVEPERVILYDLKVYPASDPAKEPDPEV